MYQTSKLFFRHYSLLKKFTCSITGICTSTDKMSFPENLDACFHLGQLDGSGMSGPENFPAELPDVRKTKGK